MQTQEAVLLFKRYETVLSAYRRAEKALLFDGMTAAPKNSVAGRAETASILSREAHKLTVGDERKAVIALLSARSGELDELTRLEVSSAERELLRLCRVPEDMLADYRRALSEAFSAWQEAKKQSDHSLFAPYLQRVIDDAARIAALSSEGGDPYDQVLGENEEGCSQKMLDGFFKELKDKLVPLIGSIAEKPAPETRFLHGHFPVWKQRRFSEELIGIMGIDSASCALSEAEHPYTTGMNNRDVRISTHYFEDFVTANMYSVLHEGGHAIYELGIADKLYGSPLSAPASAGMHEAQSRFFENIIGRSEAFAGLILPRLAALFPEQLGAVSESDFYRAVNAVRPTLKRTEADELTYSLHIMIRYELEKKLFSGELNAYDVPAEWNRLTREYLGLEVPNDREGCLQDMHWGSGYLGYFPTYALGNAYGAQIYAAMKRELDVGSLVRAGRLRDIAAWLGERVHKYGRTKTPSELIRGLGLGEFDPAYYADYLTEKYTRLYGL